MKKAKIVTVKCAKCNYEWIPRTGKPKKCPECQTRDWDEVIVFRRKAVR